MSTRRQDEKENATSRGGGVRGSDHRSGAPAPLDYILAGAAESIGDKQEKSWHLEAHSPRWALRHGGESHWLRAGMLALAILLAVFGFIVAVHTIDRVLPQPGRTAVHVPLALLVGTWSVVFLIFAAAVCAGLFVYRSGRLELRMSAHPSAAAESELAAEMQAKALIALLEHESKGGGTPDWDAVAAALRTAMSAPKSPVGVPPASSDAIGIGANAAATTKLIDPEKTVSPKVLAGAAASATSAAFWIVAASTFWHTVEPTVLTAVGTGVTAISGAVAAWWKSDPLRVKQLTQSHPT